MPTRRLLLSLPLLAAACASREEAPAPLPSLVAGYGHLTPLRLNVADVEVLDPAPGAVLVQEPAPVRPEQEAARMAKERLQAYGTSGTARFRVETARLVREPLPTSGGLTGLFRTEQAERLTCHIRVRLEVTSPDGSSAGFAEAEARRSRTLEEGASTATRSRAAEELVRQTMDELNVEFEYQTRRALRAWLTEAVTPATIPAPIGREDLPSTR